MSDTPLTPEEAASLIKEHEDALSPPKDETPLLAGKYKTVEDLIAGYKSLETKLGAPKETPAEDQTPTTETIVTQTEIAAGDKAELGGETETIVDTGVSLKDYLAQVVGDTEISPAMREQVMKRHNLDDGVLTSLEQGAIRDYRSNIADIYTQAGGKEAFAALNAFVKENYSPEQIKDLDIAIKNPLTRTHVLTGLKNEMAAATNVETKPGAQPSNITAGGLQPFKSQAELNAALNHEAYTNPLHPQHAIVVKDVQDRFAISGDYLNT